MNYDVHTTLVKGHVSGEIVSATTKIHQSEGARETSRRVLFHYLEDSSLKIRDGKENVGE